MIGEGEQLLLESRVHMPEAPSEEAHQVEVPDDDEVFDIDDVKPGQMLVDMEDLKRI